MNVTNNDGFHVEHSPSLPSSFVSRLPSERREAEEIRAFLDNVYSSHVQEMYWPNIGTSRVNEYNTKGFLDLEFPTLFHPSSVDWLQTCIFTIELHEYALNLLRYYYQRFGVHNNFLYYLLNMIMRHRS